VDRTRQRYATPGLGELLVDLKEAIYHRRGPFATIPLSAFDRFVLEHSARLGLEGEQQRRLCFERMMGFDDLGPVPLEGPPVHHDTPQAHALRFWGDAHRRSAPPGGWANGNLMRSDLRALLESLVSEGALPELARVEITRMDYEWTVQRQIGDWLFQLTTYGRFTPNGSLVRRYGGTFSIHLTDSARQVGRLGAWNTMIFAAFMEQGTGAERLTLDWFIERHRDYAQKVSAVAAYFDAAALG
jgi:hypothetical protein